MGRLRKGSSTEQCCMMLNIPRHVSIDFKVRSHSEMGKSTRSVRGFCTLSIQCIPCVNARSWESTRLLSSSIIFHHLLSSSIIFHHLPSSSIIFYHLLSTKSIVSETCSPTSSMNSKLRLVCQGKLQAQVATCTSQCKRRRSPNIFVNLIPADC